MLGGGGLKRPRLRSGCSAVGEEENTAVLPDCKFFRVLILV
jgi:hypothetical protein